jgi:hypothetical protein
MLEVPERENRNQGDKIKVNSLLDTFSKWHIYFINFNVIITAVQDL